MFVGQPSTDLLEDLGSSEGKVMATSVGLLPDNPVLFLASPGGTSLLLFMEF